MHQSRSQEQRVRGELLSTIWDNFGISSLNTSQFTPQFVQPARANVHVSSCVQLIHDFLYHVLSMSDEGLQRIAGGRNPVIIFHVHVSKLSRYKKHYLNSSLYLEAGAWCAGAGDGLQAAVALLEAAEVLPPAVHAGPGRRHHHHQHH